MLTEIEIKILFEVGLFLSLWKRILLEKATLGINSISYYFLKIKSYHLFQAGLGYFFAWQFLCYFCSAFTFFNFVIFNLLPETPYFLLIKESPERAHRNLAKFRGKKYDLDSEMLQLIEFKVDNNLRK